MQLAFAEDIQQGDFILQTTQDFNQSVTSIQLYTKQANAPIYLGISCHIQSPLPLIELILMDDAIISEYPKFVTLGIANFKSTASNTINGVLSVTQTYEETFNKIRFEIADKKMQSLQTAYRDLLNNLSESHQIEITLEHRTLGKHSYIFSNNGLKDLLKPYADLCHLQ
ncbi:hypothetical protein THMIRHAT_05600 [Thiosulfativibrio zosterae]|uniref:Uncharacterized protein n=2 Tax=Thiosulfativibrio zosterae TaxID=2675053 RepID=A0A6F8PL76_9GAMM|nr:hypothetical protein THMIRHAT_05600 [Thiosulfativibrio zosterae]